MWLAVLSGLVCCTVLAACGRGQTRIESASLVLEGCNVLTMRSADIQAGTMIVVDADTIAAVGKDGAFSIPAEASRIRCDGRYVLPGLTDMHVHVGHRSELLSYLIAGVTTVVNLGGDHLDLFSGDRLSILALRDSVAAGEIPGPTIYTSGQALDGDPPTGPYQLGLASEEEAISAVRRQQEAGYDFIKVYDALDSDRHQAVVEHANALGVSVFGHVPEAVGVEATLSSGQAVITHAEEFYPVFDTAQDTSAAIRTLARQVSRSSIAVIPNGAFIKGLILQLEDLSRALARPEAAYLAPAVRVWWEPRYNYYVNREDPKGFLEQNRSKDAWIRSLVRELHEQDVLLLAGSDASVPVALPGLSLHQELVALVESGLTPYEALRTTTANVEIFMTTSRPDDRAFGTIAVGSRADLLMLEENPLESLGALGGSVGVVLRGEWRSVEALRELRDRDTDAFRAPLQRP